MPDFLCVGRFTQADFHPLHDALFYQRGVPGHVYPERVRVPNEV